MPSLPCTPLTPSLVPRSQPGLGPRVPLGCSCPHAHACTCVHTPVWAEPRARLHSFFSCHSEVSPRASPTRTPPDGTPGGCPEFRERPAQARAGPAPEPQVQRQMACPTHSSPTHCKARGPCKALRPREWGQGDCSPQCQTKDHSTSWMPASWEKEGPGSRARSAPRDNRLPSAVAPRFRRPGEAAALALVLSPLHTQVQVTCPHL